jgi:phosphotransferase system IIA component
MLETTLSWKGGDAPMKKLSSLASVLLLSLAMTMSVWAADSMVSGTISKVEEDGRAIVVKTKDGKEVNVKISGSRTKLEGVGNRSELKAGQKVSAEVKGDSATMVKVSK